MSTELVAIERIIIGKGEKGAEQVRKDLARYLRQFLDTASIESMSLSAMVIKLDGKTALDIHNKTGGKGLDGLDTKFSLSGASLAARKAMWQTWMRVAFPSARASPSSLTRFRILQHSSRRCSTLRRSPAARSAIRLSLCRFRWILSLP